MTGRTQILLTITSVVFALSAFGATNPIAPASPEKFEDTARIQVLGGKCWTVPVLANGRIYCRNAEGDIVCVDVRPKK